MLENHNHYLYVDDITDLSTILKVERQGFSQPRGLNGRVVEISCGSQLKLIMRMSSPWKASSFIICATFEQGLQPEENSHCTVFMYLTILLRKSYAIYESVTNFPVGMLLMAVSMYASLFNEGCTLNHNFPGQQIRCYAMFQWDPFFGLVLPLYRDIWLRYSGLQNAHTSCNSLLKQLQAQNQY